MRIRIANKIVGDNYPTFIVAEIGINHNGSLKIAKSTIDKAVEAEVDAVKFQTFRTIERDSPKSKNFNLLKKLELDERDFKELADYAKSNGVIFFSTPFSNSMVDLLSHIGVPAFKISSGDLTDIPLVKYAASKMRPIIISTGMANLDEIRVAIKSIKDQKNEKIIILHSVSSYPIPLKEANLNTIRVLSNIFPYPIGFSDNGPDMMLPIFAVAVGARLIEKHFTYNKKLSGPDHKISLDSKEMTLLVKKIREIEEILGDGIKKCQKSELKNKINARRSITLIKDVKRGTKISENIVDMLKPGVGILPMDISKVIGKKVTRDIEAFESLRWSDINN